MHNKSIQVPQSCDASIYTLDDDWNYSIVAANLKPTYINFGNIKIHCETGEVTGLSENITEDAKLFWEQVKEHIIGK